MTPIDGMAVAQPRPPPALFDLRRKPIRVQLTLLVLVTILPAFLVSLVYLVNAREEARQIAREKVKILVDNTVDRLGAELAAHEALLARIAAQPEVQAMDKSSCGSAIADSVRLLPDYVATGIRDLQGNAVCAFRPGISHPDVLSYASPAQYQSELKFNAGDAIFAPQAKRWVTVLSMPVRDAGGRPLGAVVLPLDLLKLTREMLGGVPANVVVAITDRRGNILSRSKDPTVWIGKAAPPGVRDDPLAEGFANRAGADGVSRVIAFKHLPSGNWRVAAGVPEKDVFAPADTALRNGLAVWLALLLAALVFAWRLGSWIVQPLDALASTAARVAAGDTFARTSAEAGPPELESVADGFNEMLDAWASAVAVLRQSEENLAITLQSIGDAVIATDALGQVTRMNAVAERLTGWPLAQARGLPLATVFRIVNAETRAVVPDPVQRVLETGEVVGLGNHTALLARDGAQYQISDSAAPILDASRNIAGVVLVFSDVTAQYAVQQALREAYNFSRQVIDNLPFGVNVRDLQGRFLEWNPAMEAIAGRTAQQMLGHTTEQGYPDQSPIARAAISDALERAMRGERVVRPDIALERADGVQWTTGSHHALRDTQGKVTGVISVVQDITARKQAEEALRQSEENLAITLQSIGDAVIATDAQGRVTRMNPVAQQMTGWPLALALGMPLADVFRIVNAVTREVSENPVQRVLELGHMVGSANHTTLLARDGTERQISDSAAPIRDATGAIQGVVLVFSDVTEAYRLQRVLEESESRYRALVESSPVGVAVHRQGKLIYVNPTAVAIMGARIADDLVGRNPVDFIHPDDHPLLAVRAQQAETANHGTLMPMMEWRYVRLDGTAIDVQSQAILVRLKGQNAVQVSFLDITSRKRIERTLRDNEARFRALTHLSSDWYWEQDAQFRFVRIDGDLLETTGLAPEEHLGKTRWELGDLSLSEAEWERHRALLQAHQEFRDFQMRRASHKGKELWVSVSGTPIFDAKGVFCGYRGVGRDVTAQKLAADQIHALAFYDALTELPNRRLLIEQLKKALVTHMRSRRQAALLFIDLDNFKTLNDTLGHETGDILLQQVARRLIACVREADSVARLGGDEFVVMLEDLSVDLLEAVTQAEHVGYKILAAFGAPFVLAGRECRSTPSIGITLFGGGGESVEDLLKQADLAMYQAKAAGRNTLRLFDAGMQAAVDQRAALEVDLRAALLGGQMLLYYQPVVQADGRVTGAEALVRWQHPVRGRVAPGEFIGLAETTGLILPLGQWVLATACAQLATWGRQPHTAHLTLAVNVSAHQFVEPDFVPGVLEAVDLAGADPRRLKLELTESLLADNMDAVVRKMGLLKDRGIDISLDDFGTGYSSLSYLKRLPLAQLKIDQSFVRDVLLDLNDAAIARTIVALGASLGLAVIAEGVETEGQYKFLLGLGCSAFQGYLFGRPMPIDEFEAFVRG